MSGIKRHCVLCGKVETKKKTLDVHLQCEDCRTKNPRNDLQINDASSLSDITFGDFKAWLSSAIHTALQADLKGYIDNFNADLAAIKNDLSGVKNSLDDAVKNIEDQQKEIDEVRTELVEKTEEIKMLKKIIGEQQKTLERINGEKKANNVFITGIPKILYIAGETGAPDEPGTTLTESKDIIQHILKMVHPPVTANDYDIIKDFECKPGHSRHSMLLRFKDDQKTCRKHILVKSKMLKDSDPASPFKYIYIKTDMTPLSKKENDRLYQKLRDLREEHEGNQTMNVRIKFGKVYVNESIVDEFNLCNQLF